MKFCPRCNSQKPRADFAPDKRRGDGLVSYCRSCRAAISKAYRATNPEKVKANFAQWKAKNGDRLRAKSAQRQLEKRAQCLIAHARTRARRKGLAFDLDQPDATADLTRRVNAGRCEMTGTEFDFTPGRTFASPSLDRREPALGYVWPNVRVVCHGFNAAVGDWGDEALLRMVAGYLGKRDGIDVEAFTNLIAAYMEIAP